MNFIKRSLTALILLPLFIYVIHIGGAVFSAVMAVVALLVCNEIISMGFGKSNKLRPVFLTAFALSLLIFVSDLDSQHAVMALWSLFFVLLATLTFNPKIGLEEIARSGLVVLVGAYAILGIVSLLYLRMGVRGDETIGRSYIYLALVCTFSNDTFAYIFGRWLGKRRLLEAVSEKKTWAGFIAGATASVVMPFVISFLFRQLGFDVFAGLNLVDLLFVSVGIAVLAPLGDLIESRLKRAFVVKDSGAILPGHGGLFDRLDALMVTAPFTLGYAFFLSTL